MNKKEFVKRYLVRERVSKEGIKKYMKKVLNN